MVKKAYLLPVLAGFFETYLPSTRGLCANTMKSYREAFRLLLEYLHEKQGLSPEKVEFRHLSKEVVTAWLDWLMDTRSCSASTRNQRLAALATFSKYVIHEDFEGSLSFCAGIRHIPKKKYIRHTEPVHFSRDEMSILLRLPDSNKNTGRRDKVLLSILYATGARAQELCDLTIEDIRFGTVTVITLHGKGGKARTVVIPEQAVSLLRSHVAENLPQRVEAGRHHLFSSQTHEHMTISCVEAIVKKYVQQAKKLRPDLFHGNYTPHSFRHSIAMHMLESGIPLPVIKTFLGHVSISTTMIYASANFEMVSKYLRDRDPYAEQPDEAPEPHRLIIPSFLR